ncbi:MAG: hypothetical protein PUD22_03590 [Erysipelotrichaceae bacterium]|nr:hypothetical protein [Erysipelotrichaceae bacterium]
MNSENNIKENLRTYIINNEVVYQSCGELVEVSNDTEKENKDTLLGYFNRANRVDVYTKQDRWAKDGWPELTDWSTDDDVLFLLQNVSIVTNYNIVA